MYRTDLGVESLTPPWNLLSPDSPSTLIKVTDGATYAAVRLSKVGLPELERWDAHLRPPTFCSVDLSTPNLTTLAM